MTAAVEVHGVEDGAIGALEGIMRGAGDLLGVRERACASVVLRMGRRDERLFGLAHVSRTVRVAAVKACARLMRAPCRRSAARVR